MFFTRIIMRNESEHGVGRERMKQAADKFACRVITECSSTKDAVSERRDKDFIKQLSDYLDQRKGESRFFSNDALQVSNRAAFIQKLIPLIKSNDTAGQLEKLKEGNIRHFKGFRTQKLYDILVTRRESLRQSNQASHSPR